MFDFSDISEEQQRKFNKIKEIAHKTMMDTETIASSIHFQAERSDNINLDELVKRHHENNGEGY